LPVRHVDLERAFDIISDCLAAGDADYQVAVLERLRAILKEYLPQGPKRKAKRKPAKSFTIELSGIAPEGRWGFAPRPPIGFSRRAATPSARPPGGALSSVSV